MYLLDTDICIHLIAARDSALVEIFQKKSRRATIGISAVTLSELIYGIEKSARVAQNREALAEFLFPLDILPYDDKAAIVYGKVRAALERKGKPIGPYDLQIAAHAIALEAVLVSHNQKEMRRVDGLRTEDWLG